MFGDVERRVLRESAENAETKQGSLPEEFEARLEVDLTEAAQELSETENGREWIELGREHAEAVRDWMRELPDRVNMRIMGLVEKLSGDSEIPPEVHLYLRRDQKTAAITIIVAHTLSERRKRKALEKQGSAGEVDNARGTL